MVSFNRFNNARPGPAKPSHFPYDNIGSRQLRLLRYAPDSTPDTVRLLIDTVNRDLHPQYVALSYM